MKQPVGKGWSKQGDSEGSVLHQGNESEYPHPQSTTQEYSPEDAPTRMRALCRCLFGKVRERVGGARLVLVGSGSQSTCQRGCGSHSTDDIVRQVFCCRLALFG